MRKCGFLLILFFVLFGAPKGNALELTATDPDILRHQIAKALREGNIELALKGFAPGEKSQTIIPALNAKYRNLLAEWVEKAQLKSAYEGYRAYRTKWTDPQGGIHNMEFIIVRDKQGRWTIISWVCSCQVP
jgi:hypothetical protein